jgi:Domain of unknown function (DUF4386)
MGSSAPGAPKRDLALTQHVPPRSPRCVQSLGHRWPFLVPYLARPAADPGASASRREAVDVVFQSFNRYVGVGMGEQLGYGLTGAWTTLTGIALTQTTAAQSWIGVLGIAIVPILIACSLEFVGSHEPAGWKLAERLTPVTDTAWSLWLAVTRRFFQLACQPG